jgi:hypothetical protein
MSSNPIVRLAAAFAGHIPALTYSQWQNTTTSAMRPSSRLSNVVGVGQTIYIRSSQLLASVPVEFAAFLEAIKSI